MTKNQTTQSIWTDVGPDTLIHESNVRNQATQLAELVDDWFVGYEDYVDPFNWEDVDKKYFRTKGFIELSGYLLNAKGVADEQPLPEIHDLLIDRINDRRFGHMLLRSPRQLHYIYLPVIYARYTDNLEDRTAKQFEKLIDIGAFWDVERVQYRQQEYCFIFKCLSQLFGYSQDYYDAEAALVNSLLDNQPNVVRSNLPDAYCLTHDVIFYDNHLGICQEAFPDQPAPYDIEELLQGLILRFMADDNQDIVLELLLSGVLQRQISREMVQFVLSWVVEQAEETGFVTGPQQDKTDMMNRMVVDEESLGVGGDERGGDKWDYENDHEAEWGENFHTNAVAGMTARVIARDWDELDNRSGNHSLEDPSYRRDVTRLGQVLKSLADYDLETGAQQLTELAGSPVLTEYETVTQDAISFLEDQRTPEGNFGFWVQEEILYREAGRSRDSFDTNLVEPVREVCQEALEAVKKSK